MCINNPRILRVETDPETKADPGDPSAGPASILMLSCLSGGSLWWLSWTPVLGPGAFPSARTMPVTADACCRALPSGRVCFQGCEEAGRLEEKWAVFIFLCRTNYVESDALGILPTSSSSRCHCLQRSLSHLPSHLLFLVKPEATQLSQAWLLFILKMLLSLNYGFK